MEFLVPRKTRPWSPSYNSVAVRFRYTTDSESSDESSVEGSALHQSDDEDDEVASDSVEFDAKMGAYCSLRMGLGF